MNSAAVRVRQITSIGRDRASNRHFVGVPRCQFGGNGRFLICQPHPTPATIALPKPAIPQRRPRRSGRFESCVCTAVYSRLPPTGATTGTLLWQSLTVYPSPVESFSACTGSPLCSVRSKPAGLFEPHSRFFSSRATSLAQQRHEPGMACPKSGFIAVVR